MTDRLSQSHDANSPGPSSSQLPMHPSAPSDLASSELPAAEPCALMERPTLLPSASKDASGQSASQKRKRRQLPNHFLLKRLDLLYWKRLARYMYIRFLRMQASPRAIARGVAAGVFAGSFPLLGFQTLIGVAIAAITKGNKVTAAVSTWISNPLTYLPLFALNFHIGRLILQLPDTTVLPVAPAGISAWMSLGMTVTAALMVGSLVVGCIFAVVGYYAALAVAKRVRARHKR